MKIVYSDLDGTFLDHTTYSYQKSLPALKSLNEAGVPCVFVSSKTFDEMKNLSEELNLMTPFIFENGGGFAEYKTSLGTCEVTILGKSFEELCSLKGLLSDTLGKELCTFDSMSVKELMESTGLSRDRAVLALKRKASLPFILKSGETIADIDSVNRVLAEEGLQITQGGRFYHFFSCTTSKGKAIQLLDRDFETRFGEKALTMGVGDSLNDVAMLESVDYPFLVKRYDGTHLEGYPFMKTEGVGPAGFTEAVLKFLKLEEV